MICLALSIYFRGRKNKPFKLAFYLGISQDMPSKRILILTNRVPYPLKDGGNLAMKAMIDGYQKNGWQVFLLSMNTTRHYVQPDVLAGIYRNIATFETVDVNNDLRLWPTLSNFFFSSEPNHAARFRHIGFRRRLAEVLDSFRPDVVQVESPYLSVYLPDIKQNTKAFTVLRMHNVEYQVWDRLAAETSNPFKRFYLHKLAKRIRLYEETIWKEYELLLPITYIDESVIKKTLKNVVTYTVPFGIDLDTARQKTVVENWAGYHIGAMDWLPNKEGIRWFLNEIWPAIRRRAPDFEFYFAGRNMPDEFRNISLPGVHAAGEVPDAAKFIADKKILIVPIQSGGGIRVKILEAMAAGKIVISTAIGMQGIEAVEGKHYLQTNTAGEFSHAVLWCLDKKQDAEKIAQNGRKLAEEQYNNERIARDLSESLIFRLNAHSA